MKRRFALPALIAVLVAGCKPQTPGELGNGGFTYNCSETKLDLACARNLFGEADVPEAIAVGAIFQLEYTRSGGEGSSSVQLFSAASSILVGLSSFTFQKPGTAAVLAKSASGEVADFVHLRGVAIDHVAITDGLGNAVTQLDLQDTSNQELEATPEDVSNTTLSGGLDYAWQSSDEDVVELSPGFDQNRVDVFAKGPGTATIKVTVQGKITEIPVIVTGGQP